MGRAGVPYYIPTIINERGSMQKKLFITEREAAKIAALKIQTLRNWRCKKVGPSFSKIGTLVRYSYEGFLKFLEDKKVTTKDFSSKRNRK